MFMFALYTYMKFFVLRELAAMYCPPCFKRVDNRFFPLPPFRPHTPRFKCMCDNKALINICSQWLRQVARM